MDFAAFLKDKWVILLEAVTILVLFLTDVMVPPEISGSLSASDLNTIGMARYLILGIVLLLLAPFELYKKRRHAKWYWMAALLFFGLSMAALLLYNNAYQKHTAYNGIHKERYIIGNSYLPEAKVMIDTWSEKNKGAKITPRIVLEGFDEPEQAWPVEEIEANARTLVTRYLLIIFCATLFIVCGMQAVRCINERKIPKPSAT